MNSLINFSESTSLALHGMLLLAESDNGPVSVKDMAHALGASQSLLSKVMQQLGRMGYVESNRGPGGGYSLALSPEKVRLREIMEAVVGPINYRGCGLSGCHKGDCVIENLLRELTATLTDYLDEKTLYDLMEAKGSDLAVKLDVSFREKRRGS